MSLTRGLWALPVLLVVSAIQAEDAISLREDNIERVVQGGRLMSVSWESPSKDNRRVDVLFSSDGGESWLMSGRDIPAATGRYSLPIPAKLDSPRCLIRVVLKDAQGEEVGRSETTRMFLVDSTAPVPTLQVPGSLTSRQVILPYQIVEDPAGSGLHQVRLFYRIKGETSWQGADDDGDLASPYGMTFPQRGTYELYLNARDRADNSNGFPGVASEPMATVEILSGEPIVRLKPMPRSQVFGRGGKMEIQWEAMDDDLGDAGVSLHYKDRLGNWKVIAEKLPNTGTHTWALPDESLVASQIRITATDQAGNTSADSMHMSLNVDILPPSCMITGPILIKEKSGTPRLAQRVKDNEGGSGVVSLRLYWRAAGEIQWHEEALNLASIYEKIPFDHPDGIWEVILCGTDAAGNSEEAPGPGTAPELSCLMDRSDPELEVADLKSDDGKLVIAWKSQDANLGNLPVRLSWTGQDEILRNMPPEGEKRVAITQDTMEVTVTVIDLAGHTRHVRKTWISGGADVPAPPEPKIMVLSRGSVVGPGPLTLLFDASQIRAPLEARLLRNGEELLRKPLVTGDTKVEWNPEGAHGSVFQWEFLSGDLRVMSEEWRLDSEAPAVLLKAPDSVTEGPLDVDIIITEGPAAISEAFLWQSTNAGASWIPMKLEAVSTQRVRLEAGPGSLLLRVSARDSAGNILAGPTPGTTEGTGVKVTPKVVIPPELPPVLAFAPGDTGPEEFIGRGARTIIFIGEHLKSKVRAVLMENGQEILSRDMEAADTTLTWEPKGGHDSVYQWRLLCGSLSVRSRAWRLDAQPPEVAVVAPAKAEPGKVLVKVSARDRAGVATLRLWHRQDAQWIAQDLEPSGAEHQVEISALEGDLDLSIEASDRLGNSLPSPENGGVIATKVNVAPEVLLAFLEDGSGRVIASGTKVMLSWSAPAGAEEFVLEELDGSGQWIRRISLPSNTREAEVEAPMANHSNWKWRINSGAKRASMREGWKVDATAPEPVLSTLKPVVMLPEKIILSAFVKDEGPAGHNPMHVHVRRRGEQEWKPLGSVVDKGDIEFQGEPGVWEFTSSVTDSLGRGMQEPGNATPSMLSVEVFEKAEPSLVMSMSEPGDLVRGGENFTLNIEGKDLPPGRIHVRDEKGTVVAVLEGPGVATVQAPKTSQESWILTATVEDVVFSQSLKIRVDADNPVGRLVMESGPEGVLSAKVRIESEDRGPAGVDLVEVVESRDFGKTWVKVEPSDNLLEIAKGDDPVWLAVRVRDKAGYWSRAVPDAASPDLVVSWPGQEGPCFLSFVDAGVYKGGVEAEVKWRGLMKDGELQYLAGPEMPWIPVMEVKAGQRVAPWILPRDTTRTALLRIVAAGGEELFRSPTPFSIDSTPSKSQLSFLPSDVIEDQLTYTRQRSLPEPRHPPRDVEAPSSPHSVGPVRREGENFPAPEKIPGIDQVDPYDFATYMAAARDAMVRGEFGRASSFLENAHRQNSTDAESHWLLAKCYQSMHRKESMIVDELHKSLDLNARNAQAWNHLGVLAKLREDRVLAKSYFLKALDVEDLPETHLNMSILHYEDGEMVQARDGFNKVRDLLRADMTLDAYKEATWRLTMIYSYSTLKDENMARRFWAQVLDVFGRESFQGKRARHWLKEEKAQ